MESQNLIAIFLTGLLTGGLSCMAVQGGLLAATIAQREQEKGERRKENGDRGNALPIIAFLGSKLAAYTILGYLLGWFGSFFSLSVTAQVVLQAVVIVFMFGTAMNMLDIHPIFRYFVIQPPRFLARFIRKQSKRQDIFAPALLGTFTVFIPCGTTQAMMFLAIGSGNPILGSLILFAFTLGTSPVFFALGYLATRLGDILQVRFLKIAAMVIIVIAFFNLNNTLILAGSRLTFGRTLNAINCAISFCASDYNANTALAPVSEITIIMSDAGYSPNRFAVKRGSKVTMTLINRQGAGCIQAFTIPSLGIQRVIPLGSSETITFAAPDKPGEINFSCSMGMYPGIIKVL